MIISDKPTPGVSKVYTRQIQPAEITGRDQSVAGRREAGSSRDEVEISAEALSLRNTATTSLSQEDVRWDKVNQLRQQIAQHAYEVPVDALAQRLLPARDVE